MGWQGFTPSVPSNHGLLRAGNHAVQLQRLSFRDDGRRGLDPHGGSHAKGWGEQKGGEDPASPQRTPSLSPGLPARSPTPTGGGAGAGDEDGSFSGEGTQADAADVFPKVSRGEPGDAQVGTGDLRIEEEEGVSAQVKGMS